MLTFFEKKTGRLSQAEVMNITKPRSGIAPDADRRVEFLPVVDKEVGALQSYQFTVFEIL